MRSGGAAEGVSLLSRRAPPHGSRQLLSCIGRLCQPMLQSRGFAGGTQRRWAHQPKPGLSPTADPGDTPPQRTTTRLSAAATLDARNGNSVSSLLSADERSEPRKRSAWHLRPRRQRARRSVLWRSGDAEPAATATTRTGRTRLTPGGCLPSRPRHTQHGHTKGSG